MRTNHHIGQLSGIVIASLGIVTVLDVERFMVSRSSRWQYLLPGGLVLGGLMLNGLMLNGLGMGMSRLTACIIGG